MSDVSVVDDVAEAPSDEIMEILIAKAKRMLRINVKDIPNEMFAEVIYRGLHDILNSSMSKIGAVTKLEGEALGKAQDAAFKQAEENLKALMAGEIKPKGKRGGAKSAKVPQEVKTEALRLAKALVKDAIRASGEKISHYKASDITKWAKEHLETEEGALLFTQAQAAIAARKAVPVKMSLADLKPDAKLVEKAEAAKAAKRKGPLSAKQAGMVAPRAKPKGPQPTAH